MYMRHNSTYSLEAERSDGQTEKARSQNVGVEANWHPQLSPRVCGRRAVQRKSVFRSQRSTSGPVRDAAPTHGGGSLDCGCGRQIWRFAPHRLPGSGCIPAGWPDRPAPQAPWPKRRAQAVRRGHRVRPDLASCRAWLDDRRVRPSRSGKVRYHGSPPQSGAGVREQKKTAQSGVTSPIPEGTVEAYEGLRRQVIQPDGRGGHLEGRGVLVRGGFASWAQSRLAAVAACLPESHLPSGIDASVLDSFGVEIVRLVASLILSARQEGFLHA